MHVEISTDNTINGTADMSAALTGTIRHGLGHFEAYVTRVEAHLQDWNAGKSGPEDIECTLEVRLKGQRPVVTRAASETVEQATTEAAGKMKALLETTLGKLSGHRCSRRYGGVGLSRTAARRQERQNKMTTEDTLWAMEELFWTQGADSARTMTAKGAVFVFPYPIGILQGDRIWREDLVAQRWRSVEFSERCLSREKDIAVLAYRVTAEREGEPAYGAYCTSSYLNDDDTWLRIMHQQTPLTVSGPS